MSLRLNKTTSTIALLGLAVWPALYLEAQETVDVRDFRECRAIVGKAERLLCYDTIADGGVFNTERVEQMQRETFGDNTRQADISIDQLSVTIVQILKDANGMRYFFTDGDQAWKQVDRGNYSSKVPFEAEIKSGALGSYFLVNESGRSIRVKRVR
jgi:hypothetical protein